MVRISIHEFWEYTIHPIIITEKIRIMSLNHCENKHGKMKKREREREGMITKAHFTNVVRKYRG